MTYYIVTLRGSPIEVFSQEASARNCAKERSGVWGDALVVACVPQQLEFEFEEPTAQDEVSVNPCLNCGMPFRSDHSSYWCGCSGAV